MRAVPVALLAVGLALLSSEPRAEIRHERRGKEILITNLPVRRELPLRPAAAGRAAAPGAGLEAGPEAPQDLVQMIGGSAARYGFDPALIRAVVAAESGFDHRAVSRKGARGLMQLMPGTASSYGVRDLHDPASNLDAGVAYLRDLMVRYDGDLTLALAAYNAGPEAVARYGGVPPYEETRRYLGRIRRFYGRSLQEGDWSSYAGGIQLTRVDSGGVPHFTNLRRRRLVKKPGASTVKPGPAIAGRKESP